jgi:hypothetical protein
LNPRPSDYKSDALPTELRQLKQRVYSFPGKLENSRSDACLFREYHKLESR